MHDCCFIGVLETKVPHTTFQNSVLVIAGGYDELVQENIDYYEELKGLITNLGIEKRVVMLKVRNFPRTNLSLLIFCIPF